METSRIKPPTAGVDFEKEMKEIQEELSDIYGKEDALREELYKVMEGLGYGIK